MASQRIPVTLTINGQKIVRDIEPRTLLVHFLRDELNLTGTHVGCDTSQCGACTILLDNQAVKSCTVLAIQADGSEIVTVEGLEQEQLHPIQEAFREKHGLQCGFCTPGAMMLGAYLLNHNGPLTEETIREQLDGLLCRCTGYENIVRSIQRANEIMNERQNAQQAARATGVG
ncbi:MAG: (2Fe-2S)-binding protein [Firmicutes bacterium]|jgi:carbon-monoxide dehydrogenase small subunit|uniref:Carbon monoxide dehydrogenase n=1 Tax=Sulfobacillus benefaciens TaxID=453960 RepID=A0A2T2X0M4_9FIRM|nr:(2Fe-2S)-binding protein [Bacillota bacterium]MCL5014944.1 (2Fe-2S)-binding protein [Bacillota bacterium]PSR28022.1 MAG: carbon monoxide dehydrogenase [Sulfobacillus benefaciens]HBQ96439.1 carbon monoxide dehydrogenase [Sulfobacillus sp.]